jgi:predicted PurR-regulated permease PerM
MNLDRKTLLRVGIGVFLLYLCIYYWDTIAVLLQSACSAATPLLLGFGIAYFVNILMSFYERVFFPKSSARAVLKSRRPISLILAFSSLLLILLFVYLLIVPELVSSVQLIGMELPAAWNQAMAWLQEKVDAERWAQIQGFLGDSTWDWQSITQKVVDWFVSGFGGVMGTMTAVISRTLSTMVTLLLGIIFAVYLLAGKEGFLRQVDRVSKYYLKPSWYQKLRYVVAVLHNSFHRFVVGQCMEAVILGALCTLGMYLFRFPYANMVGTLVGFTALIPVAGAYIGASVGAFMIFTVSPLKALFFLLFITILQQLEGNVIYPRVVGGSIGLPGIWVLAAITIGGGLFGIVGMLLGVPLAAALYQLLRDDVNKQIFTRLTP